MRLNHSLHVMAPVALPQLATACGKGPNTRRPAWHAISAQAPARWWLPAGSLAGAPPRWWSGPAGRLGWRAASNGSAETGTQLIAMVGRRQRRPTLAVHHGQKGRCSSIRQATLALKKASESTYTMLALRLCTSHSLTASPRPNLCSCLVSLMFDADNDCKLKLGGFRWAGAGAAVRRWQGLLHR